MTPEEALDGFLDALGVPADDRGADPQAVYRELLADRRMLVVLDNAVDAAQVSPLLPDSANCLTLVTSRGRPSELVRFDGVRHVLLDGLDTDEAAELVARFVGTPRADAEPEAVAEITDLCRRLPLALMVAAAQAAAHPETSLGTAAADLAAEQDRLDGELEPTTTAVSWVLRSLPPEAVELCRVLATRSGVEFGAPVAAQLSGLPWATTFRLLSQLSRAQLIDEHLPGLYRFHDLVRAIIKEVTTQRSM